MSTEIAPDKASTGASPVGHVIVCGLRGIGLRIVEQLHRAGESVTVLEEFADQTQLAVAVGWGVTTVAPFGSSAQTLTVAGIFEARIMEHPAAPNPVRGRRPGVSGRAVRGTVGCAAAGPR